MANDLRAAYRIQRERERKRDRIRKHHTRYGAFAWREDARYPEEEAVRIFKRQADAERFADARELVVREIVDYAAAETAFRAENPRRELLADLDAFDQVERRRLKGRDLSVLIGKRGRRRELVGLEGSGSDLADALALFRDWHDRDAEVVEIADVPDDTPPVLVRLGDVSGILYRSDKWGGTEHEYIHETEEPHPGLYATPDRRRVVLLGGGLTVTGAGLEG